MPLAGFAGFDEPYLFDRIFLDGTFIPQWPGLKADAAPSLFLLPTHGRTHIIQRPFAGSVKPKDYHALVFTVPTQAVDQASWYRLKRAKAKGGAFWFAPGIRQVDVFPATNGAPFRLSRPLATGIVTGITALTHPTIIFLDDEEDPSAATVSGQNVTANADGELAIEYSPAHRVVLTRFPETIEEHNKATATIVFEELLIP